MKALFAALLLIATATAVANQTSTTFVLPMVPSSDGSKSAVVTICASTSKASDAQASDVLSTFPMNDSGQPTAEITRSNALAIVENVRRSLEANPKLAQDPAWNPAWLTDTHWRTVQKCGLGHQERVPSPATK